MLFLGVDRRVDSFYLNEHRNTIDLILSGFVINKAKLSKYKIEVFIFFKEIKEEKELN